MSCPAAPITRLLGIPPCRFQLLPQWFFVMSCQCLPQLTISGTRNLVMLLGTHVSSLPNTGRESVIPSCTSQKIPGTFTLCDIMSMFISVYHIWNPHFCNVTWNSCFFLANYREGEGHAQLCLSQDSRESSVVDSSSSLHGSLSCHVNVCCTLPYQEPTLL